MNTNYIMSLNLNIVEVKKSDLQSPRTHAADYSCTKDVERFVFGAGVVSQSCLDRDTSRGPFKLLCAIRTPQNGSPH